MRYTSCSYAVHCLAAIALIGAAGCASRGQLAANRPESIVPASAQATTHATSSAPPHVQGTRLQIPPGESAAARALALTDQLAEAGKQNEALAARLRELESEIEAKDQALALATKEIIGTRTELVQARGDLERWKQEMAGMRDKLKAADKENMATLQMTVALLQQLLAQEQPVAAED